MSGFSVQPISDAISASPGAILYFSGRDCGVCQVLWPRVEALLAEEFPELPLYRIELDEAREFAAQSGVFTIPTLICYFDGRETGRLVRSFSLQQLRELVERPYSILFS